MIERPNRIWLPRTGQTTSYVDGDDGYFQAGNPRATRLIVNANNTTTDMAEGLMWITSLAVLGAPFNAPMSWADAVAACLALDYAGFTDWRLPNIKELHGLMDYENTTALVIGSTDVWSSNTRKAASTSAWRLLANSGGPIAPDAKTTAGTHYAWPVRGGQLNNNR